MHESANNLNPVQSHHTSLNHEPYGANGASRQYGTRQAAAESKHCNLMPHWPRTLPYAPCSLLGIASSRTPAWCVSKRDIDKCNINNSIPRP